MHADERRSGIRCDPFGAWPVVEASPLGVSWHTTPNAASEKLQEALKNIEAPDDQFMRLALA